MSTDHRETNVVELSQAARDDFDVAFRKGFWNSVNSWLRRNSNELIPFDEVRRRLPITGQHYLGLRQVDVNEIVGSVSRYHDFDRAFLPKRTHTRERWESVDKAHIQDVILPPIELYKIGHIYFVKDGNHRVSVARERGQVYIDAFVIEIDTPVNLDPDQDLRELVLTVEQASFYTQTHLAEYRPGVDIRFTLPGQYDKLIEHIRVHRWYMAEERKGEVTEQEAVVDWYDQVYQVLVRVIRIEKVLSDFPGRSEADLYLWIIEHRWFLMQEYGRDVSFFTAARHFSKTYSNRPLRHFFIDLWRAIRRPFIRMRRKKRARME